jgi:hypothetical protein
MYPVGYESQVCFARQCALPAWSAHLGGCGLT